MNRSSRCCDPERMRISWPPTSARPSIGSSLTSPSWRRRGAGQRGASVYILPGIMGSRLGTVRRKSASLVWLHPTAIAEGGLSELALPGSRALKAVGVMLPGYLKLKLTLEIAGFSPVFYPFDWRQDLDRLGRAFVRVLERADAKKVLVVGHSMGGLVARAALRHDRKRRIAKLVHLGRRTRVHLHRYRRCAPSTQRSARSPLSIVRATQKHSRVRCFARYPVLPDAALSGDLYRAQFFRRQGLAAR